MLMSYETDIKDITLTRPPQNLCDNFEKKIYPLKERVKATTTAKRPLWLKTVIYSFYRNSLGSI